MAAGKIGGKKSTARVRGDTARRARAQGDRAAAYIERTGAGIPRPFRFAALCAAAAVFSAGCFLLPEEKGVLPPPLVSPPEVRYDSLAVGRSTIVQEISVSGSFEPAFTHDMFFSSSGGRIKTVFVKTGDLVKNSAPLIELYAEDIEHAQRLKEIDLRKADLAMEAAASALKYDSQGELLRIDLELEKLALGKAEGDYAVEEALAAGVGTAASRLAELKRSLDRQRLTVRKAQLRLEEHLRELKEERSLENLRLEREKIRLDLERFKTRLTETRLFAPLEGIVTYVSAQASQGETVEAYQTLVRVCDQGDLRLLYKGNDSDNFALGNGVEVEYKEKIYPGTVVRTQLQVPYEERDSYRNTVLFSVKGLPRDVTFGDYARIRLVKAKAENAIVIPRSALYSYASRRYVQVLEDGVKRERDVQPGIDTATEVEITAGLSEGELIILR
jgi:multidrug efflux pump subunit AcrA (membrane-fusion protein)